MRVVIANGTTVDLGKVEITPTIGITDFSRRVTDAFGVTTIVPRNFSRRMSMRLAVPLARADEVYAQLVDLRAKVATFIADDRYVWLKTTGIIKEFEFSFSTGDMAHYTLSIDGVAEAGGVIDTGIDPATAGRASSFRLVQPVSVTDTVLVSSTVAESDAAAWSATVTYAAGATAVKGHRIYESLVAGNIGADPASDVAKWLDTGPTNRWAMFDESLGTSTIASTAVEVVLKAGKAITALALLDTNAAAVRVRAPGYDRTQAPNKAGQVVFADLAVAASASITVTITPATANPGPQHWDDGAQWLDAGVWRDSLAAGDGTVTIGTFLFGDLKGLGVTETSATASITDFSRKEVDEFGEMTIVQRAWAKKMAAKTLIRNDAVDVVADRLAAVRAQPCLWIGRAGADSLTIYGFPREWSIEIGRNVSKLTLSIEGLSKAAPSRGNTLGSVAWPDITDPTGTKPADNADKTSENTSKDTGAVGGTPANEIKSRLTTLDTVTIPIINQQVADAGTRITSARGAADAAKARADAAFVEIGSQVTRVDQRIDSISVSGGYDDTAVKAEVSRVDEAAIGRDVALGTRVDTVAASVTTTDGNLRALVQTKEQAAVSRETAISQRIDTLVAEGGGGSEGVDTVARSEVSRVEQAAITRDDALGSRVDTVQASIGPAVNAKATEITTAFTSADQALAQRQTSVESQMAGTKASGLLSRIAASETALTDGRFATAQRVTTLEASSGGNLLGNSDFGAGKTGWTLVTATPGSFNWGVDNSGFTVVGDHYQGLLCTEPNGDRSAAIVSDYVAVQPGDVVQASAWLAARECVARILLQWGDGGASYLGDGASSADVAAPYTGWVNLDQWQRVWCKAQAPSNARFVRFVLIKGPFLSNAANNLSWAYMLRPMLALGSATQTAPSSYRPSGGSAGLAAVSARVTTTETAITDGRFATTSRVTTLESDYNGTKASVVQQAGTIVGLGQRTAAYWRTTAVAGNNRAQLTVSADANGGAGVDIVGDVAIDGSLNVKGSITSAELNYGSTGECSIFYSVNGVTFSTSAWIDVAVLSLTPFQGQPVHGVFTCILTDTSGPNTQAACRIIRDDGTALWGGSGGLQVSARDEGESLNASFFDSVNAGRPTVYKVQMRKASGSDTVRADFRSFIVREMSREHFQQISLTAAAGEGPGRGTAGGGNVNGLNRSLGYYY